MKTKKNKTLQLYNNAINSIKLGIEDYKLAKMNPNRIISSIRNIDAGILLLMKEELRRKSPKDIPELLLFDNIKLSYDKKTNKFSNVAGSKKTVTYDKINVYFKMLGEPLNKKARLALDNLHKERNNIEHHHPTLNDKSMESLIANSTIIISELLKNYLEEIPIQVLGETWSEMLQIKDLYDFEKKEIDNNLKKLLESGEITKFQFDLIKNGKCSECGAQLLNVNDNGMGEQIINCKACDEEYEMRDLISDYIEDNYSLSYRDIKHGEQDIVFECPECGEMTYIRGNDMNECLNCEHVAGRKCCPGCGEELELYEMGYLGNSEGLCSACAHIQEDYDE